eukprot:scaffold3126_cov279-Pinguiococcus_pyrenoidosus.AAC.1
MVVPGSIVSVTPAVTKTCWVNKTGESAVQVVSEVISPLAIVAVAESMLLGMRKVSSRRERPSSQ